MDMDLQDPGTMTREDFLAAVKALDVPMREAARLLGLHYTTIYRFARGEQAVPMFATLALQPARIPGARQKKHGRTRKGGRTGTATRKQADPANRTAETAEILERVMEQVAELKGSISGIADAVNRALAKSETRMAAIVAGRPPEPTTWNEAGATEPAATSPEKRQPRRPAQSARPGPESNRREVAIQARCQVG